MKAMFAGDRMTVLGLSLVVMALMMKGVVLCGDDRRRR